MGDRLRVDVDGGKYTVVQPENGGAYVLRYGEPWLDDLPAGANCWLAMAYELEELRAAKDSAVEALSAMGFDDMDNIEEFERNERIEDIAEILYDLICEGGGDRETIKRYAEKIVDTMEGWL